MKERLRCRCIVCELEKGLLDELRQEPNVQSYRQLASQSSILSAFPTTQMLLDSLAGLTQRDRQIHLWDQVLGELLRMGASCNRSIACQLILLILIARNAQDRAPDRNRISLARKRRDRAACGNHAS